MTKINRVVRLGVGQRILVDIVRSSGCVQRTGPFDASIARR
jgi:hypothetical protein